MRAWPTTMRPARGLQSHSEWLPSWGQPHSREGGRRQHPGPLGREMLQGGRDFSVPRTNHKLKLQEGETLDAMLSSAKPFGSLSPS